jgi:hypothetical protein
MNRNTMADILCGYTADRDEILTAYLYGEIEPAQRVAFEAHIATCERCRRELADLQGVRAALHEWTAPEAVGSVANLPFNAHVGETENRRGSRWLAFREMPAWARVAAAFLVIGVSAGFANLDVHYDRSGLTIRTGWSRQLTVQRQAATDVPSSRPGATASGAPWRADLDGLEQRLRTELRGSAIAAPAADSEVEQQLLRRVRALVQESERRQQNELALRIAEVSRDFDSKRGADLVNIDRSLRTLQSNTGIEVARQQQLLNYLTRVSLQK